MNSSLILAIVIVIITVVTVSVTLGVVLGINSNYKKFVFKNSESLRRLAETNAKYQFRKIESNPSLYYKFDNKRNWYNTQPIDYFSREVRNNIEKWAKLKADVDFNAELLEKYKENLKRIFIPISAELCEKNKMKTENCRKHELKYFNAQTIKPTTSIKISVRLRYVSPKGKVDESKSENFGYIELKRILDSVSTKRVSRDTYDRLARAERGILSDSIRYDVLKRDNFRCVLCGMSSKDGAILHVDHIIPVSKGGKTVMSNLRTLCEKCNVGKSNKIE